MVNGDQEKADNISVWLKSKDPSFLALQLKQDRNTIKFILDQHTVELSPKDHFELP